MTSTITINSIKLVGNGTLNILGTVILKVADQNHVSNPIDFAGGAVANASLDPSHFQVVYGGTGDSTERGQRDGGGHLRSECRGR